MRQFLGILGSFCRTESGQQVPNNLDKQTNIYEKHYADQLFVLGRS